MIWGEAAVCISFLMLSDISALFCLPLAPVCSIYLFVSGDFSASVIPRLPTNGCPAMSRRCREKGLAPVACALWLRSQPAVLQLLSL